MDTTTCSPTLHVKEEQPGGTGVLPQNDEFRLPPHSDVVRGYSVGRAVEVWGVPTLQCSPAEYDDLVRRQVVQREMAAAKEVRELLAANPGLGLQSHRDESGKRSWLIVHHGGMNRSQARLELPLPCDS